MPLYYQPPLPNIGGQQPLTPASLTPPSGPATPSNPIFGAVSLVAALVAAWSATGAPLPPRSPNFIPPLAVSGPPPQQQGTRQEILAGWLPAPPAPQAAINLNPPVSGPAPQAPPLVARPTAIDASWLPSAYALPQTGQLGTALLAPPPVAVLPVSRAGLVEVEVSWARQDQPLPLPPQTVPISGPAPQAPPIQGGASIPEAVLVSWLPPPPLPPTAVLLSPPISGPVQQPPPGAAVPEAILVSWLPPPPAPPTAVLLNPPIAGPTPQPPPVSGGANVSEAVLAGWLTPAPQPATAALLNPPISGPVPPQPPPGASVPEAVLASWLSQTPPPQTGQLGPALLLPPPAAFLPAGAALPEAVLISWLPPAPLPPSAINLNPPISSPTPQAPPIQGGSAIPEAVLVQWVPPPPLPPTAALLTPPSGPAPPVSPPVITPTGPHGASEADPSSGGFLVGMDFGAGRFDLRPWEGQFYQPEEGIGLRFRLVAEAGAFPITGNASFQIQPAPQERIARPPRKLRKLSLSAETGKIPLVASEALLLTQRMCSTSGLESSLVISGTVKFRVARSELVQIDNAFLLGA